MKTLRLIFCAIILLFGLLRPTSVAAIEDPSLYFDYNTYQEPKVLGVSAQEPATTEAGQEATAQETTPSYKDYKEFGGYFLKFTANFAPDNPLYFLKRLQEDVALALTTGNPSKRVETLITLGGKRASEMETMAIAGKAQTVASLAESYNNTMADNAKTLEDLKDKPEATALLLETDKEVAKHLLTLEEVSLKVPPEAAPNVEKALAKAEEVVDTVADVAGRPAVPTEMISRLQAYKAQGLLTEEEINKIVLAKTRQDARSEFRKLAENRIVPLADVKKFDEAAYAFYPDGYARAIELRKFKELKELEKNRPDEETLEQIQDFAKSYKPGDIVPPSIRSWWAPMVRAEELQATFRPDLISPEEYFKYRPEEQQKYQELVERFKPTEKDVRYVKDLMRTNPAIVNDPSFARILTISERFGTADSSASVPPAAQSCSASSHWVNVPFMPGGGYCVPDLVYEPISRGVGGDTPCPPNYYRATAGGPCLPDNPGGVGITKYLPAPGSCPSGYHWVAQSAGPRGGYCAPDYMSGGGGYPNPITPPSYCPAGKIFRDGKCEDYNPPPKEGCPQNSWWNGQKCIEQKNCGEGKYQDSNGECKSSEEEYKKYETLCKDKPIPIGGCGSGWWDMASCSCVGGGPTPDEKGKCPPGYKVSPAPQTGTMCVREGGSGGGGGGISPSREEMKAACERGGCRWTGVNNACECPSGSGGSGYSGGSSGGPYDPKEACLRGGGCKWENNSCKCAVYGGPGGGGYGGGYSGGGSYNPQEMCTKAPNCRWENNSCQCSSSGGGSYTGGGTSGGSSQPSCGSGYYWNGSSCVKSESQPSYSPPSYSPPPTESQPPPSSPPPGEQPPPSNPPPGEQPPASNPPPAENPPPPPPSEPAPSQ